MKLKLIMAAAALAMAGAAATPALAQNEQFMPVLPYRTGGFAPNGIPWANGYVDYLNMINERDGGINGVKMVLEECETAYATDRGVECYERLKSKGPTGASVFNPLSTGITFALMDKAPVDKIPVITMGYGRSEAADGSVVEWTFPLLGTYWTAADIQIQYLAKVLGGYDKLKGKKIAHLFLDSPYGKEPIPVFEALAKKHGFEVMLLPVAAASMTEQKSTWLQIRQARPDFVLLWGYGTMNSAAIKEAAAVGYPRDKMLGGWWAGAEPDVTPAEDGANGYKALAFHPGGAFPVHADIVKHVYDKGKGVGKKEDIHQVLYNRGMINAMLSVEAIRTAQAKFGNKPLTGEQVRWGIENLKLPEARLKEIGFAGLVAPFNVSCENHEGPHSALVHQWDAKTKTWKNVSDWMAADQALIRPMIKEAAAKYAKEKNITPRDCSKVN